MLTTLTTPGQSLWCFAGLCTLSTREGDTGVSGATSSAMLSEPARSSTFNKGRTGADGEKHCAHHTPEGDEPGLLGSGSRLLMPLSFLLYMPNARLMFNGHAHPGCTMQGASAVLAAIHQQQRCTGSVVCGVSQSTAQVGQAVCTRSCVQVSQWRKDSLLRPLDCRVCKMTANGAAPLSNHTQEWLHMKLHESL